MPSRLALLALGLSVLAIANDFTALNVVVPALERDFGISLSAAQWVINAYTLVFAMLIVPGGRIADLYGRTRMFIVGTTIFVVFSLVGAAAPHEAVLIAARALMAIGGAIMWPAVLGMTFDAFGRARAGLAGGFVLGVAGLGNALGPVDGGLITELWSWRGVLLLNLPIGAFAVFVVWRTLHEPGKPDTDRTIDYPGIAALGVAMLTLLLALDDAPEVGWGTPRTIILLAVSVTAFAGFALIQRRRGPAALVPPDLVANRAFRLACAGTAAIGASFFVVMLYIPQVLQKALDASELEAGLGMLPMLVTFAAASFLSGQFYDRLGPAITVLGGAIVVLVGMVVMALVPTDLDYWNLIPPLIVFGIGFGMFQPTVTSAAVTALDDSRTSLAGGVLYMFTLAGGAIGLGAATTIVTSVAESVSEPVGASFVHAVTIVFWVLAGLSALTAVLATGIARASGRPPRPEPEPATT